MYAALLLSFLFAGLSPGVDLRGATPPALAVYQVEAYLDHPPKGTSFVEEVLVGQPGRARILYIVSFQRLGDGDPWDWLQDRHVYAPDFLLQGRPEDVERLLGGPEGAKVRGRFRHIRSAHTLLIQVLDAPRP